jgi:glutamine cyclotransferase
MHRAFGAALVLTLWAAAADPEESAGPGAARAPLFGYRVLHVYPHDRDAFTQGLIYVDGALYESTGLKGASSLRRVDLETGKVLQRKDMPRRYFAEGLTSWGGDLVQLTYRDNLGFVYDRARFAVKRTFRYDGEGWGLTTDGTRLIMSDGSANLRFLDPSTFRETGRVTVRDGGTPVANLNELEYVRGEVYANVWKTDRVARIAPDSGRVTGWIDLGGLLDARDRRGRTDVLNGIAYDDRDDRLFVTGKFWPKVFEIQVLPTQR